MWEAITHAAAPIALISFIAAALSSVYRYRVKRDLGSVKEFLPPDQRLNALVRFYHLDAAFLSPSQRYELITSHLLQRQRRLAWLTQVFLTIGIVSAGTSLSNVIWSPRTPENISKPPPLDVPVRYTVAATYNTPLQQWEITERITLNDLNMLKRMLIAAHLSFSDSSFRDLATTLPNTHPTSRSAMYQESYPVSRIRFDLEESEWEKVIDELFVRRGWTPISLLGGVLRFEKARTQSMTRHQLDSSEASIHTLSEIVFKGYRDVRLVPDSESTMSISAPSYLVEGTHPAPTTQSTNSVNNTVQSIVPLSPDTLKVSLLASGRIMQTGKRIVGYSIWGLLARIGGSAAGLAVLGFVWKKIGFRLPHWLKPEKDSTTPSPQGAPSAPRARRAFGQPESKESTDL